MDLTDFTKDTLRGLTGVTVIIESIKSDAQADGLKENDLQADVESRLNEAGIRALPQEEWRTTPGRPWLYVSVNTIKYLGSYFFSLDVQLKQEVTLLREPAIATSSSTWELGSVGFVPYQQLADKVRGSVAIYVNQFIAHVLEVNEKLA